MNIDKIFADTKDTFCSLWQSKVRGETLEIMTPFTTPNSRFISVFLTQRKDQYIVTDGGWLMAGEYYDHDNVDAEMLESVVEYFESYYDLKTVKHGTALIFFKSSSNDQMVPNLVHDISQFISQVIASFVSRNQAVDIQDDKEVDNFRADADQYLVNIVGTDRIKTRQVVGPDLDVKFNAVIQNKQKGTVSLVKYITGYNFDYYKRSLSTATADYQLVNRSNYNPYIDQRIAIINDSAPGYQDIRLGQYISLLEDHLKQPVTLWSQKRSLREIL